MLSTLGSATAVMLVALAAFDLEALSMYGLLALLVGMIAWSKYREPPLSDPYAAHFAKGTAPGASLPRGPGEIAAVPTAAVEKAPLAP